MTEVPRLTIVAVTYRQVDPLLVFLNCLNCQTLLTFKVHVLHDGDHDESREVLETFKQTSRFPLEVTFTEQRFNDWGHSLRAIGLQSVDTDFVLLTNADNYYVPRFVEFAFDAIDANDLDLLHWDMVHSHDNPGRRQQRSYCAFETSPQPSYMDIGAFMAKSAVSQWVGFNHRSMAADGIHIADLMASGKIARAGHLKKILLVHN